MAAALAHRTEAEPLSLQPQLDARAAEDEAWLRQRAKSRYLGLEQAPGTWFAPVQRRRELDDQMVVVWFPGKDPGEALARARAWVQQQIDAAAQGGRRAA